MSTPAGTGPGHGAGGDRIAAGPISWGVRGDAALGEVVAAPEESGYAGWYVLEQDTALTDAVPPRGDTARPTSVRPSVEFLAALLRENVGSVSATEGRADRPNA